MNVGPANPNRVESEGQTGENDRVRDDRDERIPLSGAEPSEQGHFEETRQFLDRLKRIKLATSLGGVTSLANQPVTNTHAALSPANRAMAGVSENLVRLSVGTEPVDLLMEDIDRALSLIK